MKPLILSLFLSFSSTVLLADFNYAVEQHTKGNYAIAFQEFQTLAEIGNKSAQFNLGIMYFEGKGVKQDLLKAYGWIKLSDVKDKKETELLQAIQSKISTPQHIEMETHYQLLKSKYSQASIEQELLPRFKLTNDIDPYVAKPIKTKPANYPRDALLHGIEGWVRVEFNLTSEGKPTDIIVIEAYPENVFEKTSLKAVKKWTFEIPEEGSTKPINFTLKFVLSHENNSKAKKFIASVKALAERGDAASQYLYAKYKPIISPSKNFNPTEWFYKSAKQGAPDSMHELGLSLLRGKGCEADKAKGLKWLGRAASANLGRSQFELAKLYKEFQDSSMQQKSDFWLDKSIASKDSQVAYDIAKYIYENNLRDANTVIEQLNLVDENMIQNKVAYYELYAKSNADLGDYKKAVSYQQKANKVMKRLSKVPSRMRKALEIYKSKG